MRGKKYEIDNVITVKDLKDRVKEVSGIEKEHYVLYGGKRLDSSQSLREAGVSDGEQINMVPASSKTKSTSSSSGVSGTSASALASSSVKKEPTAEAASASAATASPPSTFAASDSAAAMKDYLKQAGVDTDKLDDLMKEAGIGGGSGGANGEMPDLKESLDMMSNMMKSPLFQEYMGNAEMLEQSRQMILNNPMLKSMMAGMPGMEEILNDPDAWREAMQAAANMYKNLDPEQLQSMMGGMMNGMGGEASGLPPGFGGAGLFDGTLDSSTMNLNDSSAAAAALDELDEDD